MCDFDPCWKRWPLFMKHSLTTRISEMFHIGHLSQHNPWVFNQDTETWCCPQQIWKSKNPQSEDEQKNDDFFFGKYGKISKRWLITTGNGRNWHNLNFQHFIALPHFSLFVEVEFEQLLREMAGNARQAEGAVVWVELLLRLESERNWWSYIYIYICIVYLFLKSRALWNTLGL